MAGGVTMRDARAQKHGRQLTLFSMAGVFNTALDLSIYAAGVALGLAPLVANAAAFFVANMFSYLVNAKVTFRRDGVAAPLSFGRYAAFLSAHLLSLAISTSLVFWLADEMGPFIPKAAAVFVTLFVNYGASAFVAFRPRRGSGERAPGDPGESP